MLKNNLVLGTEVFFGNWSKPFSKKIAKELLTGKYNDRNIFLKNDPRKHSAISSDIIKFKLSKKNLSLEKVIKWPLKNVKKVVFSVKNTNQLKEIMNIFKNKKL